VDEETTNVKEPRSPLFGNLVPTDSLLYRKVVLPFLALLRVGASPERLAWSIAVGLLIGINPLLGTTTILSFAVAIIFRLNLAASQLANHLVYPLQLLLLFPFLHLGSRIFHTPPIPLSSSGLLRAARHDPAELIRRIWLWEWHALILWAALSLILVAPIALILTPTLRRLSAHLQRSRNNTGTEPQLGAKN
jgi:hypothetical protein